MLRAYYHIDKTQYKDFENFLFTNKNEKHSISFDYSTDKVTINAIDYRISTIIDLDTQTIVFSQTSETDKTAGYKIARTDDSTATEYYCKTNADGKWYILKISSNTYTYTRGDSNFETNWTNRVTLTYVEFHNLIW